MVEETSSDEESEQEELEFTSADTDHMFRVALRRIVAEFLALADASEIAIEEVGGC